MGATTFACPICFGIDQGPVTEGVRTAVLVLIGVTVSVLAGFGVFITRFVRRMRVASVASAGAMESRRPTPGSESLKTVEKKPVPLCQ